MRWRIQNEAYINTYIEPEPSNEAVRKDKRDCLLVPVLFSPVLGSIWQIVGFQNGDPVLEYKGEKRNWEEKFEAKEAVIVAGFNPSDYF